MWDFPVSHWWPFAVSFLELEAAPIFWQQRPVMKGLISF